MSKRRQRRERGQKQRPWQPLRQGEINPRYMEAMFPNGLSDGATLTVWGNDLYEVTAITTKSGVTQLAIKRLDRHAIRDWRHLQQIKNEVCGPEREGLEVFPAESRLIDTTNQYYLWVMPEGEIVPVTETERQVMTPQQIREANAQAGGGKARQRPWQPGLTTGLGDGNTKEEA